MNQAKKRIWAFFLAAVLLLTSILPAMGQVIVSAAPGAITLKLHYHRADGDYTDWDVWAWSTVDGNPLPAAAPFLFDDVDGEKVATIEIPAGVTRIGYIVRKNDWSKKDIDADQFLEFPEVESGTLHFYVESGVEDGRKDYSEAKLVPTLLKLHYDRPDGEYTNWDVWAWAYEGGTLPTSEYEFADEDGEKVATIDVVEGVGKIGFLVRKENWEAKDWENDRIVDLSDVICGTVHIYVKSGVEAFDTVYASNVVTGTKVKSAVYKGKKQVEVTFTGEADETDVKAIEVKGDAGKITVESAEKSSDRVYVVTLASDLEELKEYTLIFKGSEYPLVMPVIYSTPEFEEAFTYDGDDLGLTVGENDLTFKVWAPMAEKVTVNVYEGGTANANDQLKSLEMTAGEKGVFTLTAEKDLLGKYYTYVVTRNGKDTEVVDPYARSTGVNGKRGMILDLSTTDPEGWEDDTNPNAEKKITDAVIYELHMRDLSSDPNSGITNVGKYLQFTENDTKLDGVYATGVSHIRELGVSHVHILPMYDYGSVDEANSEGKYNWGYDPVNYNVPEGSYSTDPYNGEVRVKELKEMVKAMHDNGLSVVMDVVYNHVQDGGSFCINQILPGYFSRISDEGVYSNGSGCGNDTASERSMVSKYIVDSVVYWATEYHLDGFRFDLVGLLDTETVNKIVEEVHKVRPDVIFYGEGWTMGTAVTKDDVTMATQVNSAETPEFAYFNDNIRDGLKGSVFEDTATAYVNGGANAYITTNMMNSWMAREAWSTNPSQIVQYVSCHDNLTIFDKLAVSASGSSEDDRISMNKLAAAIYLTAQGVPLIMSGEEMLRSKVKEDGTFDHNSYASPDSVNSLKWNTLNDNKVYSVYEYYQGLIAFRNNHPSLRLATAEEVSSNIEAVEGLDENVLAFNIKGAEGDNVESLFVIFNPNKEATTVTLPDGDWDVYVNAEKAWTVPIETVSGTATVEGISAMVLAKDLLADTITLNKESSNLTLGKVLRLTATVLPESAVDTGVSWASDNLTVASVDDNGCVTPKKVGTATITATTAGGLTATCKVTVIPKTQQIYRAAKGGTVRYTKSISTAKSLKAKGYKATRAFLEPTSSKAKVYWVYATKTKHYRYTTDRSYAVSRKKAGCKAGVAFYAYDESGVPVYELVKSGVYTYTTDKAEATSLKKSGYTYKGIAFYAFK